MQPTNTLFTNIYNKVCATQERKTSVLSQYCAAGAPAAHRLKYKYDFFTSDVDAFNKAQKIYWTLTRFFRGLSLRKKIKYSVAEDLYGVPLVPAYTIELVQDNCVYRFSIHDLFHIIKTSLSAVLFNWYPNPKMPCNPYTNKMFGTHHLYSIYCFAFMQAPRLLVNQMLIAFLRAEFHLDTFKTKNHNMLLEMFINTMVAKDIVVTNDVVADIILMLELCCNPFAPLNINARIEKPTLYNIFRPYLRLFYKYKFLKCNASVTMLKRGLRNFALFNPLFGHIYYDYETKKIEIDLRCLSCGDFSEDNSLFESFAQIRGGNNTLCLPPVRNAYYYPLKSYRLERPELKVLPRDAIYMPPDAPDDETSDCEDDDTNNDDENVSHPL